MVDASGNELLSLDEAAQFLGISKPTIYRLLSSGQLKGVKVGRQWRFRKSDVAAYTDRSPVAVAMSHVPDIEPEIEFFESELHRAGRDLDIADVGEELSGPESRARILVHRLIELAVVLHASDIHLDPARHDGAACLNLRYRVDGALQEVRNLPESVRDAVLTTVKTVAGMDIAERRLPQDGRIQGQFGGTDFDIRVNVAPSVHGEGTVMRILDKSHILVGLEKLGFSAADVTRVRGLIHQPNGIIVTAGPTGSGKTTTMYSCLAEISGPQVKTVTIEDPVEYALPFTTQMQVNKKVGLTFASGLRNMLRMDPDIILVGETRDLETAKIAAEASLTGHLVFMQLHTDNAPSTVFRLLGLGVEPHIVAATVTGVIAQRLARRICEGCKQEVSASHMSSTTMSYILGLAAEGGYEAPEGTVFFQGAGCDQCRGKGFRGRFALVELLEMNEQLSSAILSGATAEQFESLALQCGMRTMFADGIQKAAEGLTSVDEVMRVTFTAL